MPSNALLTEIIAIAEGLNKANPSQTTADKQIKVTRVGAMPGKPASLKLFASDSIGMVQLYELQDFLQQAPMSLKLKDDFSYLMQDKEYSGLNYYIKNAYGAEIHIKAGGLDKIYDHLDNFIVLVAEEERAAPEVIQPSPNVAANESVSGLSAMSIFSTGAQNKPVRLITLEEILQTTDPKGYIKECQHCEALKRTIPHNLRDVYDDYIVNQAKTNEKDTITLLVIGSGEMKQEFTTSYELMQAGKNVNLILIEPRFCHNTASTKFQPDEKLTPEQIATFEATANALSQHLGKKCKIIGQFGTLSSYWAYLKIGSNHNLSKMDIAKLLCNEYKTNSQYKALSDKADYLGKNVAQNHLRTFGYLDSLGTGFINEYKIAPPAPDMLCAIDLGQDLAEACKDLATFIIEDCYPHVTLDSILVCNRAEKFTILINANSKPNAVNEETSTSTLLSMTI